MSSTEKSSINSVSRDELRSKVIGLGEKSFHKNYYGKLKRSIHDLELFGAVLEQISDIIVLIDEENIIMKVNEAACSFFDRDRHLLQKLPIYEFDAIPYDSLKTDDALTVVLDGLNLENHLSSFLFSVKKITVAGEDYHVLVGRDVSRLIRLQDDQMKYEKQLHQYQKSDMVSFLAGSIAHDFNNILTGILAGASLLSQSSCIEPGSRDQKIVDMIMDATERASDLVSNLINISRKGKQEKEAISLLTVLNESIDILRHTIDTNIRIELRSDLDSAFVLGSASALHSAFLNLGINASHAIRGKGRISFDLARIILDKEYCLDSSFYLVPGEYYKLTVEDTGTGIPSDILDKIFDALFTTKEEGRGTGLGLSSVMNTVRDHSGEIQVSSMEGVGTVFSLLIPALREPSASSSEHDSGGT